MDILRNSNSIKMKKNLVTAFLAMFTLSAAAQEVVIKEDVQKDTIVPKKGPNRKHFKHLFVGYGFIVGPQHNTGESFTPRSNTFVFGWRYKRKFNETFSSGIELAYMKRNYLLTYLPGFPLVLPPSATGVDWEKLSFADLDANLYLRINYGRRGNKVGKFIDVGGGAGWIFYNSLTTKFSMVGGDKMVQRIRGYGDLDPLILNGIARVGFNRYVLFAQYRLSQIGNAFLDDLPKLSVGFQVGLH